MSTLNKSKIRRKTPISDLIVIKVRKHQAVGRPATVKNIALWVHCPIKKVLEACNLNNLELHGIERKLKGHEQKFSYYTLTDNKYFDGTKLQSIKAAATSFLANNHKFWGKSYVYATIIALAKHLKCDYQLAKDAYFSMEENDYFVENMFKVEPPLTEMESGFGYIGVVRHNTITDRIQCHICGKWFRSLSNHVVHTHNMSSLNYKIKHGLPTNYPLVSRQISGKISDSTSNLHKVGILNSKNLTRRTTPSKHYKYNITCAAFENKKGVCKLQMERRFFIVSDIVGREPTVRDLRKYDSKLLSAITHRFRTINKYRETIGLAPTPSNVLHDNDIMLLAKIRKKVVNLGRPPKYRDFRTGSPTIPTLKRRFGSFNRAIVLAGFSK